ncbi:MAG: BspA family leucine-rich repeat surface protein [Pseudomonadales bacterium]|nr:BspA family leucine-rich repeat surface protein [Pseudomonadales bacterium]
MGNYFTKILYLVFFITFVACNSSVNDRLDDIETATDTFINSETVNSTIADYVIQDAFITTWKTDNEGGSDDNQIKIPENSINESYTYDYTVDWGDGLIDNNVTGEITHTYAQPGTYTVAITGVFPRFYFYKHSDIADAKKLLSIEQWGDNRWQSMNSAFYGCENLQLNATDVPDFSLVQSMRFMFEDASSINQDISSWDVSSVTNMDWMFSGADSFNQNISSWDVSNVTSMRATFDGAENFNQNLSSWNVSSVSNMTSVFANAVNFNQDISNWDVSNVTNMWGMFNNAENFNQDLSSWDVSSVTDMTGMFNNAKSFNQDISNWNVSSVTNMAAIFFNALNFNQDISNWDVSLVTQMWSMFSGAESFDQNLSSWNVSSVIDMHDMFEYITLSTANYDALLVSWSSKMLNSDVTFDGGNSLYTPDGSAQTARATLIDTFGWTITDGGPVVTE